SNFSEVQKYLQSLFKGTKTDVEEIDKKALFIHDLHFQLKDKIQILSQDQYAYVKICLGDLFKEEQTDLSDINDKATFIQQLGNLTSFWEPYALDKWIQACLEKNLQNTNELKQSQLTTIGEFIQ